MTGKDLFKKLSIRDYSGSSQDIYAQWLRTLYFQIDHSSLFELLELADKEGKKISTKYPDADEYQIENLILV